MATEYSIKKRLYFLFCLRYNYRMNRPLRLTLVSDPFYLVVGGSLFGVKL